MLGPVAGRIIFTCCGLLANASPFRKSFAASTTIARCRRVSPNRRSCNPIPAWTRKDIAVTCDKRYLRDVRICMTKDLQFRACPEIDRRGCRLDKVVMPPLRH